MIALLSPAKKMECTEIPDACESSQPRFLADAETLIRRARRLGRAEIAALMGISEALADLNWRRYRAFSTPFTPANARPAMFAFRGDTYVGLDADTLKPADLAEAQRRVRILSGLYGLLRPLDLVQPYRLEMGAPLATRRGRDLYAFWGARLAEAVDADAREAAGGGEPVVANLASEEYFKAVGAGRLRSRLVRPVFQEVRGGTGRVVGLFAKRARGMMARFIVESRLDIPEGMKDFTAGGYRFDPRASDATHWVFSRAAA